MSRNHDAVVRFVLFSIILTLVLYVVIIVTATHKRVTEMSDLFEGAIVLEQPYQGE